MDSRTIRKTFLDFYAERGHTVVPSASLIPDDPSVLFTIAGMLQFRSYFLGEKIPPFVRATSVQKCFRAVDIELVGTNARNITFFEMLGNFSFGDYFKREAIKWAWELSTEGYGLDPNRIWVTVYPSDEETASLWQEEVGLPKERILWDETNFWHTGAAGPCGPDTEMYYDRGEQYGPTFIPGEANALPHEDRYMEFYNLVFIQDLQDDQGEVVGRLPNLNVDTGLGLDRLAAILQGRATVFEQDSMWPVLEAASERLGKKYGQDPSTDLSIRVIGEHARSMTMLIADGVLPSNEERGYVLRRLIRRAVRYARLEGLDEPFLVPLTKVSVELFADVYPEVARNSELVERVVEKEEERFDYTLRQGLGLLEEEIRLAKASDSSVLSGSVAFRLHDTYGFPLDLTADIAAEEGLSVDASEFERLMKGQRDRARAARFGAQEAEVGSDELRRFLIDKEPTDFLAYEHLSSEATVIGLISGLEQRTVLEEGAHGELVLDRSPFYPEGGGQVGDRGEVRTESGVFRVTDTKWGVPGVIVHIGDVVSGEIRIDQSAMATVAPEHRDGVRQSHTATHVLHWALRHNLGEHARQQGSLVEPGRLRFDFSHFESVSKGRLSELEEEINTRVLTDDPVRAFETTYDYAMSIGAMALFGEKYGEYVRVVEVGDYSKELCGGTHVHRTGQLGVVTLVTEASVGAGLRRVEAYTGMAGLRYLNSHVERLKQAAELLKVTPDKVVEQIERTLEARKALEAQLSRQQSISQKDEVRSILSENVKEIGNSRVVVIRRDGREVDDLRKLAIELRKELGSGVVVIGSSQNARANLVAASSRDLLERGVSSKDLLAGGARILGGGAGGKPDLAVAGGPKSEEIERAMSAVEAALKEALELR